MAGNDAPTPEDAEDAAEPTLGGEVILDPDGPADLSLPERYGPEDLLPASTDADAGRESEADSEPVNGDGGGLTT